MLGGLLKSIIGEVDSSDEEGELLGRSAAAPDLDWVSSNLTFVFIDISAYAVYSW